jgi:hypothetical protein
MIRLALAAMLAFPTLAMAKPPSEHTLIPGMADNPAVEYKCQFLMSAGYIAPGDIMVTDTWTGEVLFSLHAGGSVAEDKCINSPDGHALDVLAPGSEFKRIGANP